MSRCLRKLRLLASSVLLVGVMMLLFTLPAAAATFNPSTAAELITAIETANDNGEADIINLATGTFYTLTLPYTLIDNIPQVETNNGLPMIASEITINGNDATIERSSATGTAAFRILQVTETGNLTLNSVTITNGGGDNSDAPLSTTIDSLNSLPSGRTVSLNLSGAGILNEGTLAINNSTLEKNYSDDFGGAVFNDETGTLEISSSLIKENLANLGGGITNTGVVVCTDTEISGNLALMACGLFNYGGIVTLYNCVVKENQIPLDGTASDSEYFMCGGGIVNLIGEDASQTGVMEINDCTIKDNLAIYGGGIANGLMINDSDFIPGGDVTIHRCTISTNIGLFGAGLSNLLGSIMLENSTISGNTTAPEYLPEATSVRSALNNQSFSDIPSEYSTIGGGCLNIGFLGLSNCTVTSNQAETGGGIISFDSSMMPRTAETTPSVSVSIKNTIIAGNIAANGTDCFGLFNSYGFNLIGALPTADPAEYTFDEVENPGSDRFSLDPLLGLLQDNGGKTFTHALLVESPAINAGDCKDIDGNPVIEDQRREFRPYIADGACDIGAYEYPSLDGTGVPPTVQNAGPNNGDGNGDGIPDSRQRTVASLPAATGSGYLTVEISGCDQLSKVESSTAPPNLDYDYPFGLVSFEIDCPSATVRVYYHGVEYLGNVIYRKYGPTPDDWDTPTWYEMPGVNFGTKEINGKTVPYAEFFLSEGTLGDDTALPPIVDAGGLAAPRAAIPTLNEWGIIIMSLLLTGVALITISHRRNRIYL